MTRLPSPSITKRLLSGGFRLFFPGSALIAALSIAIWVPWFLGFMHVPTLLPPLAWHQHELLFGFVPAVIAGFLLTAVPNWTGRPGLKGLPLLALFLLWMAGRLAISLSEWTGLPAATLAALAFLPVLAIVVMKELLAASNRRNYKIVAVLALLSAAQILFHYEIDRYGRVEMADRLALSAILILIALVAGRIIPAFTGNWLKANNPGRLPENFSRFDLVVMILSGLALALWVTVAGGVETLRSAAGALMILAALAHLIRQARWCPERTLREPLVTILHVGYLFIPVGFLLTGLSMVLDHSGLASAGIHAWTTGGIGVVTLAVMTRATRGHTGQALTSPRSTTWLVYAPIVLSAVLRIFVALSPQHTMLLLPIAALAWIVAFLSYIAFYMPLIARKG
ncbi:NnrS family protein [Peteryoungia ipomoeae]|uniref:NnrS family protein n=1 Tax=Peteryoungia ipomoeae TaxID=1210932 RepID=A0A4S8NU11_9HYPH|nr:NnrS family protein [Peteryoungia ipomoeae]THV20175.1 NnrS family protein [Peteryoungia ipomoeae]